MRKHWLSCPVLQSFLIWTNFKISFMFTTLDKRIDLGEPDCTRGSGGSTTHQSNWPQQLGLTLCPGPVQHPCIVLTHPQNLQNPAGLRKECHPSLRVLSHLLVISGGLSQLLLCHLDCKEIKRENQEKRHALTDIPRIQNSWLHCLLTIVLLNVNHSVYYSYYSFTSYNRLDPSTAEVFPLTLLGVGSGPQCHVSWVLPCPVVKLLFHTAWNKNTENTSLMLAESFLPSLASLFSTNGVDWFTDNKEMYPHNDPIF